MYIQYHSYTVTHAKFTYKYENVVLLHRHAAYRLAKTKNKKDTKYKIYDTKYKIILLTL